MYWWWMIYGDLRSAMLWMLNDMTKFSATEIEGAERSSSWQPPGHRVWGGGDAGYRRLLGLGDKERKSTSGLHLHVEFRTSQFVFKKTTTLSIIINRSQIHYPYLISKGINVAETPPDQIGPTWSKWPARRDQRQPREHRGPSVAKRPCRFPERAEPHHWTPLQLRQYERRQPGLNRSSTQPGPPCSNKTYQYPAPVHPRQGLRWKNQSDVHPNLRNDCRWPYKASHACEVSQVCSTEEDSLVTSKRAKFIRNPYNRISQVTWTRGSSHQNETYLITVLRSEKVKDMTLRAFFFFFLKKILSQFHKLFMACAVFMTCTTFMLVLKKPLALLVASSVGLRRRCNFEQLNNTHCEATRINRDQTSRLEIRTLCSLQPHLHLPQPHRHHQPHLSADIVVTDWCPTCPRAHFLSLTA